MVYTKSPLKSCPYGIIKYNNYQNGIVSTLYAVYGVKDGHFGPFIDYYFQSSFRLNKYLKPIVNIGAKNDMKVNNDVAISGLVTFPSLPEQRKITDFLKAVDERLEKLERKKELLDDYKRGVIQKIFSQELRFKNDEGNDYPEWSMQRLKPYLVSFLEKSTVTDQHPVMTSSNKGLMLQSDYFGKNRITDRDNVGFNIIPAGFITYRSRSDNRLFTFNINDLNQTGLISVYYPVFSVKDMSARFLVQLLNTNKHYVGRHSVGTSQTVLSFNELSRLRFSLPALEEQTKIADFLSTIDRRIESVAVQITETQTFKKGLLQQMFV